MNCVLQPDFTVCQIGILSQLRRQQFEIAVTVFPIAHSLWFRVRNKAPVLDWNTSNYISEYLNIQFEWIYIIVF